MRTEKDDKAVVAGVLSAFPEIEGDKGFADAMKTWLKFSRDKRRAESLRSEPSAEATSTCSVCLSETSRYIYWPRAGEPVIVCVPCVRDMMDRVHRMEKRLP